MSYNGIGLPTPRGSGTSGHIQGNFANNATRKAGEFELRKKNDRSTEKRTREFATSNISDRAIDRDILEHDSKRKIEAKCFELRDKLEEAGNLSEDQIEEKVQELRDKLTKEATTATGRGSKTEAKKVKSHEIHELSALKEKDNERMRSALDKKPSNKGKYKDWDSYVPEKGKNSNRQRPHSSSRSRSPPRRNKRREDRRRSRSRSEERESTRESNRSLRPYE